jgi:AraC-like DNA-binding protein
MLGFTNISIKEIADKLNFPTQTFFGKYFKQYVGISPKEYRKRCKSHKGDVAANKIELNLYNYLK